MAAANPGVEVEPEIESSAVGYSLFGLCRIIHLLIFVGQYGEEPDSAYDSEVYVAKHT